MQQRGSSVLEPWSTYQASPEHAGSLKAPLSLRAYSEYGERAYGGLIKLSLSRNENPT